VWRFVEQAADGACVSAAWPHLDSLRHISVFTSFHHFLTTILSVSFPPCTYFACHVSSLALSDRRSPSITFYHCYYPFAETFALPRPN